jgi:hypothetical protein
MKPAKCTSTGRSGSHRAFHAAPRGTRPSGLWCRRHPGPRFCHRAARRRTDRSSCRRRSRCPCAARKGCVALVLPSALGLVGKRPITLGLPGSTSSRTASAPDCRQKLAHKSCAVLLADAFGPRIAVRIHRRDAHEGLGEFDDVFRQRGIHGGRNAQRRDRSASTCRICPAVRGFWQRRPCGRFRAALL